VTIASGKNISGLLASQDEFTIVVLDAAGARRTFEKDALEFKIDDPMSAHFDQLGKYTDNDMHNVFAYLERLK
jgi:cytochrome c oxidase cbb3-type subunit 3